MSTEPRIFIKATHHEPGSDDLTGLKFTIEFGSATALVSIEERPPIPFQDRLAAYQALIEDLAKALLQAAQSPQSITENPQRPE
jgi:hypothetical protein